MTELRTESDTIAEGCVPFNVHFGAQTERAAENFKISVIRFPRGFCENVWSCEGGSGWD